MASFSLRSNLSQRPLPFSSPKISKFDSSSFLLPLLRPRSKTFTILSATNSADQPHHFVEPLLWKFTLEEQTANRVYRDNKDSVVKIYRGANNRGTGHNEMTESGSGCVWDKMGHIVTNFHVVQGASIISVTLDGDDDSTSYEAELVAYNKERDVALLRIIVPEHKLKPIRVGKSSNLQVGQTVYAIGYPHHLPIHTPSSYLALNLSCALSVGMISGLNRRLSSSDPVYDDVIQIDATLLPGNSGGPLFDSNGFMIGLNLSFDASKTICRIGFSIPVEVVDDIVKRFVNMSP